MWVDVGIDEVKLVRCLLDDGVGEGLLGGLGGLKFVFEGVAESHEFVDFGDDAVLFGEGGDRDGYEVQFCLIDFWHSYTGVGFYGLL